MPHSDISATYRLVVTAMEERRLVLCRYQGRPRVLCPVVLGWSEDREKLLGYQLGGQSSRPLTTPETRWRCLFLDEVSDAVLGEAWPEIDTPHQASQTCVREVDYDINPKSPFHPRHKLGWQR